MRSLVLFCVLVIATTSVACNLEDNVDAQGSSTERDMRTPDVRMPDEGTTTLQPDLGTLSSADMALDMASDTSGLADMTDGPMTTCARTSDCPATQYCLLAVGSACGLTKTPTLGVGVCMPRPSACPPSVQPVCGCNGKTYLSSCSAEVLGEDIKNVGACPDACDPSECTDPTTIATCQDGSEQQFICARPTASATCRWEAQDCPALVACTSRQDCKEGDVCGTVDEAARGCNLAKDLHCHTPPSLCGKVFSPVCGCDGITYDNPCFAFKAGVEVSADGACECDASASCKGNQYCARKSLFKSCPSASSPGECKNKEVCFSNPTVTSYVCGCDGVTYPTSCAATSAGTSASSSGPCPGDCVGASDCDSKRYCDFDSGCGMVKGGTVKTPGTCKVRPIMCQITIVTETACGCDGNSYTSECNANRAGTDVSAVYKGTAKCVSFPK